MVGRKEIRKVAERKMDECFGSWLEMVCKVEVDVVLEAMALTAELEAYGIADMWFLELEKVIDNNIQDLK